MAKVMFLRDGLSSTAHYISIGVLDRYLLTITTLVKYLVSKILGKIPGTEILVGIENLGTR